MKKRIIQYIIDKLVKMDKKAEHYAYETAPYCGHYHNGHVGQFTEAHFLEGMGSTSLRGNKWLSMGYNNDVAWFVPFPSYRAHYKPHIKFKARFVWFGDFRETTSLYHFSFKHPFPFIRNINK